VLASDKRRLDSSETVAVDQVEKQPAPSVLIWNRSEKPLDFGFREVGRLMPGLTTDDVHSVSLSYVGRDLDAFTHFRELGCAHGVSVAREAAAFVKMILLCPVLLLFTSPAVASHLPPLLSALPEPIKGGSIANTAALPLLRVKMNTSVLALDYFSIEWNGTVKIAERIASYRRDDGETFEFRVDGGLLSVATTFDDCQPGACSRPTFAHIVIDGKTYFVSGERPDADSYIIAPTSSFQMTETVRYSALPASEAFSALIPAAFPTGKRRAVRPGPPAYRFSMQGVLATSYRAAINDRDGLNDLAKAEQLARDRMQHAFDYTNAALANSGYYRGRWYLRQVVVRDVDDADPMTWAENATEVQQLRAAVHGCGTFIMSQGGRAEALRNSPGKVNPKVDNVVAGGYFASWDDGDMRVTAHELGHTLGMDHNWEDAPDRSKDPQWYARARYDCARKERDLMSYNRCGDTLTTLPIYSGPAVIWNGTTWGSDAENNVLAAVNVGPFLDESQISN